MLQATKSKVYGEGICITRQLGQH